MGLLSDTMYALAIVCLANVLALVTAKLRDDFIKFVQ